MWLDLRYSIRLIARNPWFSFVAILVLALGLAANITIFSLINAFLFRPLPVEAPDDLLSLYSQDKKGGRLGPVSYPDYQDIKAGGDVFSDALSFMPLRASFSSHSRTEVARCQLVSANYFSVLGIRPVIGRGFLPEEDGAPDASPFVVISHGIWKEVFDSDSRVLDRNVKLNGRTFAIVGVAPDGFKGFWMPGAAIQFWIPISMVGQFGGADLLADRAKASVLVIGRRKPGLTIGQTKAAVETRATQLARAYPATNTDRTFRVLPTAGIRIFYSPNDDVFPALISIALMSTVAMVLLIATANIAGLFLARGITRRKEIAVRAALGGGGWKIVRQVLTETLLLSSIGGIAGLVLARFFLRLVMLSMPAFFPSAEMSADTAIDLHVMIFTGLVCVGTGIVVGIAPGLQALKTDMLSALNAEYVTASQKERRHFRHWIIIPQICLSLFLLVMAGFFVRILIGMQGANPGFDTKHTAVLGIDLRINRYSEAAGRSFYSRLLEGAQRIPGVTCAGLMDKLPFLMDFEGGSDRAILDTDVSESWQGRLVYTTRISPGYFQALDIRLVQGRDILFSDRSPTPRVAIISEKGARLFWPGESPIGKRLGLQSEKRQLLEIIGVAKDVKVSMSQVHQLPIIYVPLEQHYVPKFNLVVRSFGNPAALLDQMKKLAYELDENVAVVGSNTIQDRIDAILSPYRMAASLFAVCGFFGLLLASAGLYSVVSYSVARRTRELGIRAAMGATSDHIVRLVIGEGVYVISAGVISGLLLVLIGKFILSRLLPGMLVSDMTTVVGIAIFLVVAVLLACYIPARRAARLDPMAALRQL